MARTVVPTAAITAVAASAIPTLDADNLDLSDDYNFTGGLQSGGTAVATTSDLPDAGDFKNSVGTVVTTNVNLASPGVLLGATGRVCLAGQTDPSENFIYDFVNGSTALVRSSDADADAEVSVGACFFADDTGDLWRITEFNGTLDTDDITVAEFDEERDWVTVTGAGNGSDAFLDLSHDDVDASSLMVFDGGLALTIGGGNDYTFSQGGGAGGVDRVAFEYTPSNGSNLKAMYLRL